MLVVWYPGDTPLQVFAILLLLVRIIGWAPALAGLAVTLLILPLTMTLGRKLSDVRRSLLARTDARIKVVSEAILGEERSIFLVSQACT